MLPYRKWHQPWVSVRALHGVGLPCSGLAVRAHAPVVARRGRHHHPAHRGSVQFRRGVSRHEQVVEGKPLRLP